jgi:hypothetical protein
MSKTNIEEGLYNINDYTDVELYEILDLLNPSDRELEAKILFFIRKYNDIGSTSSKRIVEFFESVYSRFFDTEDEDEDEDDAEGYQNLNTQYADKSNENYISNYKQVDGNTISGLSGSVEIVGNVSISGNKIIPSIPINGNLNNPNSPVVFTQTLDYAKDSLNPLLKQTTTRIISIDSQYRDDKASLTTDFAFDLSEPLKDVVSMKLYSFQIPYTWYTIGKSFGCNFFYLKGNTAGINNGNHDIEISIAAGNYSPSELATSVQTSIKNNYSVYTDVSFATTNISYNTNTSLSTIVVDLKKQFTENGYYINFPYFTSPYMFDTSRNDSIPTFFGLETGNYFTNSIKSNINLPLLTEPSLNTITKNIQDNTAQFIIQDNSNNFFRIIKYLGPAEYTESSVVDTSFSIYFTSKAPGKYSRNTLITDLSNALYNCPYLDNTFYVGSSISRKNIDASNGTINNPNSSYIELKIKPNRKTTNNIVNSKIAVEFPYEDPNSLYNVWTGDTSCFRFNSLFNEVNTIYAEYPLLSEPQIFLIDDQVQIYLKCVHEGFILPENDIVINIPSILNPTDNYTYLPYPSLDAYISAINVGIVNADNIYGGSLNTASGFGTRAFSDVSGYFNIYLDIEKKFDQSTYVMDLTTSIFNTNNIKITDELGNTLLTDLTKKYNSFVNTGGIFVTAGTIVAIIYPKPGTTAGNQGDVTYTLSFTEDKIYTDYTFFEIDVNKIFNDFVDPISGRTIFAGTKLSHVVELTGYQITLTINIAKKLVSKNYSVNFSDKNKKNDSWRSYLFIDTIMYNTFYNLEAAFATSFRPITNSKGQQILVINELQEITVTGITPIIYNYLNIQKGVNNIINIIAYEDGVKTDTGNNNLVIDILKNTTSNTLAVTENDIIDIINAQLSSSIYFKGSVLSTYFIGNNKYLKIRINANRTYTASDYNLVFYDKFSFVRCFVGATSVQNTTWDSTLGWILGFRNFTVYNLSEYGTNGQIITLLGDTGVCTNLYNYFLLCLDDYNQNHLNDGLVTITGRDSSIPLPSYANKENFTCDPATGQLTYNTTIATDYSKLTQNKIYALVSIANNKYNTESTGNSVSTKSYGQGPYAQDVFAILPMKVAGLQNGVSYMEYGGTLQNQGRQYFGPVNIRKMAVSLVSDRGNKVDLNNANWSFSIICEQLNKLKPSKTT